MAGCYEVGYEKTSNVDAEKKDSLGWRQDLFLGNFHQEDTAGRTTKRKKEHIEWAEGLRSKEKEGQYVNGLREVKGDRLNARH